MERITIRRMATFTAVSVTRKVDGHSMHWQVRVFGPTPELVASAIEECRSRLVMFAKGIELAE
jgi:hypothetical protein